MADDTKTPTKRAPRKPKAPDRAELQRLLEIAEGYTPPTYLALLHRFETEEGGKRAEKSGATTFALAGVKAESTAGAINAMGNWLARARRIVRGAA